MDPLRIVARVTFTFALLLILIRVSGKRTIKHGNLSSFVVPVVVGDLFDDFFWAEVPASQFVVAVGSLIALHLLSRWCVTAGGMREWIRDARAAPGREGR
jgi:uncharacterized membrane protein YcaP (DUF421 family)